MTAPLLEIQSLRKVFPQRSLLRKARGIVAVDGVSLTIYRGETLALVGESGSGKSTLGRTLLRLIEPTGGRILFEGTDVTALPQSQFRLLRERMQMVFQDPAGSLNPRMRVEDIVAEPLVIHGRLPAATARHERVLELLSQVGLPAASANKFPHEFSGGQRQRIGLARALATSPTLLVADEPVSALDVSIQAQIVNLLRDLQVNLGLSYLFISHDLRVVRHLAHRVAVMYLGRLVESGPTTELFASPRHPYTKALLSSVPTADKERRLLRILLEGDPPSPTAPPSGCSFHPRCALYAKNQDARCRTERPEDRAVGASTVACHFATQ